MSINTLQIFQIQLCTFTILFSWNRSRPPSLACLKLHEQEFVERLQTLKKTWPDKQLSERPVQEVIKDEISEELARGEEEGRKVPFVLV